MSTDGSLGHAQTTLELLRQAEREGIDVDDERIAELEAQVERKRSWAETERITVRIPVGDLEQLDDQAATRSDAIRQAIESYCDEHAILIIYPRESAPARGSDIEDVDVRRVTVRCPAALVDDLDQLVECGLAPDRSRAIRDAIRGALDEEGAER